MIFNPIWNSIFSFKRTLTSFKFFFSLFKTHTFNLRYLIIIIVQKLWCFPCSTYFLCVHVLGFHPPHYQQYNYFPDAC